MHLMGKNYICNNANKKCKALRGSIFQVLLARSSISQVQGLWLCQALSSFSYQFTSILQQTEFHVLKGAVGIGPEQVLAPGHHVQHDIQVLLACRTLQIAEKFLA